MPASAPAAAIRRAPDQGVVGQGALLTVAGALFWSLSGVLVRLVEAAGSWQIVLYRSLAMTATLLLILGLRYDGRVLGPLRRAGSGAVLAGVALSSASCLYILALAHVTVANALFMSGIAPFVTALVARVWLGEAVPGRTWAAMTVAVAGVVVMVGGGLAPGRLAGNLLALGSAVSVALVSVLLRRGRQGDMTPAVFWSGLVSAALGVAALLLAGDGAPGAAFAVGPRDLLLCSVMGSVQLGLGSVCYTLGARHLPAAALQLLALLELVFSPLWVWLVVGEVPAPATLFGGALVMAASALQAVGGRSLMKLRQTA